MEPVSLYKKAIEYLGTDCLTWSPDARKEVFEKKSGVKLSDNAFNMLEAMVTLNVTNSPWKESSIFEKIVWALNGYVPNMMTMEIPPSYFINYCVAIMASIDPNETFSEDVLKYVASSFVNEGLFVLEPPIISKIQDAQKYIDILFPNNNLKNKVKEEWGKVIKSDLTEFTPNEEDSISIQVGRLALLKIYLDRKAQILTEELK